MRLLNTGYLLILCFICIRFTARWWLYIWNWWWYCFTACLTFCSIQFACT